MLRLHNEQLTIWDSILRQMRTDTTVTESNIHYPTDAQLLADAVKIITRQANRLCDKVNGIVPRMRNRFRSTKKRILELAKP